MTTLLKHAMQCSILVASCGLAIAMLEDLAARRHLTDGGILSWNVARYRRAWMLDGMAGTLLEALLSYRGYLVLLGTTLAVSLLVPFSLRSDRLSWLFTLVILVSILLQEIRSPYGLDGSDQVNLLLFSAAAVSGLTAPASPGFRACYWFVALQMCLSYFIAGFAKAISPEWRSGRALTGIMSTAAYGHRTFHRLLQSRPWLATVLCWGVILFECSFPLVLLAGWNTAALLLVAGIGFHALNAVFMGLNNFFWAFVSTYPIVFVCSQRLV